MLFVMVSAENNGTNGAASLTSVSDSVGNTYTNRGITNYDPGAARAGVTLGFFTTLVTTAITDGDITVNFSPNTQYKAAVVYKLAPTASGTPTVRFVGSGLTGNEGTTAVTITTSSLTSGDIVFGAVAYEILTLGALVPDTDTTRGSWSAVDGTASGFGVDWYGVFPTNYEVVLLPQYKEVTSSGTQTWDTSITGDTADFAANYIAFYEAVSASTYTLTGVGGTYTVDENTLTGLQRAYIATAEAASYSISGTSASTVYSKAVFADSANYSVTGATAGLIVGGAPSGFTMPADGSSYVITGQDITYDRNYVVIAATASYTISGTATDFYKGKTAVGEAGAYSVSGTAASFLYGHEVAGDAGSYSISGTDSTFLKGSLIVAASGSYSISGQAITMTAGQRRMDADGTSYEITGTNAGVFPSPPFGTVLVDPDPRITFWSNRDGLVLSFPFGYSFAKYIRRSYNVNGNGNIFITTAAGSGIFDSRGHVRVTIVDGSSYTGIYASDGSINAIVVDVDDLDPDQLFHETGALRISEATIDTPGLINQNNGSLLVANIP
jgi:hypothetical protein